jgi:hypothetical protein
MTKLAQKHQPLENLADARKPSLTLENLADARKPRRR